MSDLSALNPNQHPLIAVYETNNFSEAYVIVTKLASEDIPAIVQRESAGAALGISIGQFGLHYVLVHAENSKRALELLYPDSPNELPTHTEDHSFHQSDAYDADEHTD
jgi:hypothetical protein